MNYMPFRCLVPVACLLLASFDAGAAARGPSAREAAAAKATRNAAAESGGQQDLASWLARLEGSFAISYHMEEKTTCRALGPGISGPQSCTVQKAITYASRADCRRIGAGAGMHCAFEPLRRETPEGVPAPAPAFFLSEPLPARALFGIDPASGKISLTTTGGAGVTFNALGSLQGDDVSFKGRCDTPGQRTSTPCTWSFWIQAPSEGRRILFTRAMRGESHLLELVRQE